MATKKAATKETVAAEVKTEKKAPAKTTAAKKTTAKTAVTKTTVKKTAVKETVYVQFMGNEVSTDEIMKKVKENWTKVLKNKVGDMKSVTLYIKPEEGKAYFVINDDVTGSVEL
ncbi:MAG: DUF6465 family protein [Eubacteriales bacterium]|nr:DUF6465 family protein [Eubacteriales bacterium]